jgi:hypothetical protein
VSGSFNVVLGDIASAAGSFSTESSTFRAIMPEGGPSCPDGGDASVNKTLATVVDAVGLLHAQIANAIEDHASKLKTAHDKYQGTEEDVKQVCQDLTRDASLT